MPAQTPVKMPEPVATRKPVERPVWSNPPVAAGRADRENSDADIWYVYDDKLGGPVQYNIETTEKRFQRNVEENAPAPPVRRRDQQFDYADENRHQNENQQQVEDRMEGVLNAEAGEGAAAVQCYGVDGKFPAEGTLDTAANNEAEFEQVHPDDSPSWDAVWVFHERKNVVIDKDQQTEEAVREWSYSGSESEHSSSDEEAAASDRSLTGDLEQHACMSKCSGFEKVRCAERSVLSASSSEETEMISSDSDAERPILGACGSKETETNSSDRGAERSVLGPYGSEETETNSSDRNAEKPVLGAYGNEEIETNSSDRDAEKPVLGAYGNEEIETNSSDRDCREASSGCLWQ